MSRVSLSLLGQFQLKDKSGEEIALPTRKTRALLAYLAVPLGRSHSREKLINLLWADRGEEQARGSFRNALTSIRKALSPDVIVTANETVSLSPDAVDVDIQHFEKLAQEDTQEATESADALFAGPLLDGISFDDPDMQAWLDFERARTNEIANGIMRKLLTQQTAREKFDKATETARRLLVLDPLQEDIHRELMRIYTADGQRGLALNQYTTCQRLLAEELDLKPDQETEALVRAIRHQGADRPLGNTASSAPKPGTSQQVDQADRPVFSNRPSIAVMPFENRSDDPEQAYFADGIVEEITAALSRVRSFFVIARNSAFIYKDKPIVSSEVARDLDVRYLLQGSVRRAGERLRISAELIDAEAGEPIWSDRYDGQVDDVFDLQDQITESVVGILQPTILKAEIRRVLRKRPDVMEAYDYTTQAFPKAWALEPQENADALELIKKAIELDPGYALAHALFSWCTAQGIVYNWIAVTNETKIAALKAAKRAYEIDAEDPLVLTMLATAETLVGNLEQASVHIERALAFDRNSAWAWIRSGWIHVFKGEDPHAAIHDFQRAKKLSPYDPLSFNLHIGIGMAHFVAAEYEPAIEFLEKGMMEKPEAVWANRPLSAAYALSGQDAEAKRITGIILETYPGLTASRILDSLPHRRPEVRERYYNGLCLAGLPER